MKLLQVAAIIVTHNSAEHIADCLASLRTSSARLEVHIIDNASTDRSRQVLDRLEAAEVECLGTNIGFARAVNRAADRIADADFLLLLNPDAVLHEGSLDRLFAAAVATPGAGLWGGRMYKGTGELDPTSCLPLPSLWQALGFALCLSRFSALDPERLGLWDRSADREVPALTGAALLIDRGLWRALKGFDPDYFMYGEDVDLCVRARRAGYAPRYVSDFTYTHIGGGSSQNKTSHLQLLMCGKITLLKHHLAPASGWIAARLMLMGVALRASLEAGLRPQRREWRETWRRRNDWRHGWETRVETEGAPYAVEASAGRSATRS